MTMENWQKSGVADSAEKRKVVLGITGSIAAYKAAEVARLFVSWGFEVRVVLTECGQKFITPTTMEAISGGPVVTSFWNEAEVREIGHIGLGEWADVLLIAPATADVIAKMAHGIADTPLLAMALSTKAPIMVAPAMNVNMYEHEVTQKNLQILKQRGVVIIDPEEGALACGVKGNGRLANPFEIFYQTRRVLSQRDFLGKSILITTGPTREYVDPVRFISNRSSGKMGVALAREAYRRGADVTLVHGQVTIKVPHAVRCFEVVSAQDMQDMVMRLTYGDVEALGEGYKRPDVVIMAAAVADYRPVSIAEEKIKKTRMPSAIALEKNPDILLELGKKRDDEKKPILVGFAVETGEIEDLLNEARQKLETKHADMIVGNFAQEAFDLDTNRAWLVDKHGKQEEIATTYKSRVANKILDAIHRLE